MYTKIKVLRDASGSCIIGFDSYVFWQVSVAFGTANVRPAASMVQASLAWRGGDQAQAYQFEVVIYSILISDFHENGSTS